MFLLILLLASFWTTSLPVAAENKSTQTQEVETKYDAAKDITTVALKPLQISGKKKEYLRLQVATSFEYPGQTLVAPDTFKFEIRSIVKGRKLNPDLYVVFLIDGETIHLGSNRWAMRTSFPGPPSIGEVIEMKMPSGTFLKLISAKQAIIRMGDTEFPLSESHKETLRQLADRAK